MIVKVDSHRSKCPNSIELHEVLSYCNKFQSHIGQDYKNWIFYGGTDYESFG